VAYFFGVKSISFGQSYLYGASSAVKKLFCKKSLPSPYIEVKAEKLVKNSDEKEVLID